MVALPRDTMTSDEFLAWDEQAQGRFELHDGVVIELTGQTATHGDKKFAAQVALKTAIAKANVQCHMLPDGMAVRISSKKVYKPDGLVYGGPRVPGETREIADPIIIAEVLSKSTRNVDQGEKVYAYFSLPSVQHYIVIDPERPPVIHHARQSETSYLTRLMHTGGIELNSPGVTIDVTQLLDL